MKNLSIAEILAADDLEIEAVECPEWGGQVWVRSINSYKQDGFDQKYSRGPDGELDLRGYRADMVAMCLCDEEGSFTNPTDAEIKALATTANARAVDRIFGVCQRLTGNAPGDAEVTEKNLGELAAANGSG